MSGATIELVGVRHRLSDHLVLDVPGVEVAKEKILAVLGPSGAGKTSLLKIMGLLTKPQHGSVLIDGRRARPRNLTQRRRMAAAMQSPVMWSGSVIDNAAYGLKLRRVPRKERIARAEAALAEVGLTGIEARDASVLSGGEAQRVGLARAIACEPEILLLDEPLAHIDEPLREQLARTLKRFTTRTGCATVWVTHDRAEALSVSDEIAVIEQGSLTQMGPTMEVFLHPVSDRVARLVGTDNILRATVLTSDEGLVQVGLGAEPEVTIQAVSDQPQGSSVFLLIRPEEVLLFDSEPAGPAPRNRFPATVTEVVMQGATAKIYLDAGFPLVGLVTRPTVSELMLAPGTRVFAAVKASSVHLVPAS